MKVLFVCRANVARSQMAEAIYNRLTHSHDASSAGTHVERDGEGLKERARRIGGSAALETMEAKGYDMTHATTNQINEDMIKIYDQVICMAAKRFTPLWLRHSSKYVYWKIRDPRGHATATITTFNKVEAKVKELISNKL